MGWHLTWWPIDYRSSVKQEADVRETLSSAEEVALPIDLLKRFTPTPLEVAFELSGTTIRLATNSDLMRDRLRMFLPSAQAESQCNARVFWRIVVEPEREARDESPGVHRMSHGGLAFVRLGHRSFLAYDRQARQGISFISETLVRNDKMFSQYLLPALMSLLNESIEASL
jgi:hypothetical protein